MKPFLFSTIFSLLAIVAIGQHNHFVYLQSDNKQPFYVRHGDKLYSSASSGYIIIPKLQQGSYNFNVGFPQNEWPQQTFSVEVGGEDQGYLLKNFESKGWGLFNIQTMAVIMDGNFGQQTPTTGQTTTQTDDFSSTLAAVVNTPSIKQVKTPTPIAVKEPEPVVEPQPAASPVVAIVNKEQPKSSITKINVAADNVATVYKYHVLDEAGIADTVDVVILNRPTHSTTIVQQTEAITESIVKESATEVPVVIKSQSSAQEQPKFIDIELSTPVKQEAVNAPRPISSSQPELKMPNSDCKSIATEDDFLKARKKMTAQKSDDDMVNAAKKLFKQKCYSTEQIKNLSVLFLNDQGKYKFFDAAYPFVHDSGEFKQLAAQLTDAYYISRFQTMIKK